MFYVLACANQCLGGKCNFFDFLSADKNYKHFFSLLEQPNKEL